MSKYTHTLNYSVDFDDEIKIGGKMYYLVGKAEFDITAELCESDTTIVEFKLIDDDKGELSELTEEQQKAVEAAFDEAVSRYISDNAEDIAREVETDWDEESDYRSHRRY